MLGKMIKDDIIYWKYKGINWFWCKINEKMIKDHIVYWKYKGINWFWYKINEIGI